MLADDTGDVPWRGPHGYGLFDGDTRMLHGFVLELDGQAPTLLSVTDTRGFEARHDPARTLEPARPAPGGARASARRRPAAAAGAARLARDPRPARWRRTRRGLRSLRRSVAPAHRHRRSTRTRARPAREEARGRRRRGRPEASPAGPRRAPHAPFQFCLPKGASHLAFQRAGRRLRPSALRVAAAAPHAGQDQGSVGDRDFPK